MSVLRRARCSIIHQVAMFSRNRLIVASNQAYERPGLTPAKEITNSRFGFNLSIYGGCGYGSNTHSILDFMPLMPSLLPPAPSDRVPRGKVPVSGSVWADSHCHIRRSSWRSSLEKIKASFPLHSLTRLLMSYEMGMGNQ